MNCRFKTKRQADYAEVCVFMWNRYKALRDAKEMRMDSEMFRAIAEEVRDKFPMRSYYTEVNVRNYILVRRKGTDYERLRR